MNTKGAFSAEKFMSSEEFRKRGREKIIALQAGMGSVINNLIFTIFAAKNRVWFIIK